MSNCISSGEAAAQAQLSWGAGNVTVTVYSMIFDGSPLECPADATSHQLGSI